MAFGPNYWGGVTLPTWKEAYTKNPRRLAQTDVARVLFWISVSIRDEANLCLTVSLLSFSLFRMSSTSSLALSRSCRSLCHAFSCSFKADCFSSLSRCDASLRKPKNMLDDWLKQVQNNSNISWKWVAAYFIWPIYSAYWRELWRRLWWEWVNMPLWLQVGLEPA